MNNLTILFILLPVLLRAQNSSLILSPRAGLSLPSSDFQVPRTEALSGYQTGLHIDKQWKWFGVRLYGGAASNRIGYSYRLPESNSSLSFNRVRNIGRGQLSQLSLELGAVLSFQLFEKLGLNMNSKFGLSQISLPDFKERVVVGTATPEEYLLFKTKYEDHAQHVFQLAGSVPHWIKLTLIDSVLSGLSRTKFMII